MTKEDLGDDRFLRAWAIGQVLQSPWLASQGGNPDIVTAAQRVVSYVKGNGTGNKPSNGGVKR